MQTDSKKKNIKKCKNIIKDRRFTLFVSFIMALILWSWVSTEKSPTESVIIRNVPVSISLTDENVQQLGLQAFGDYDCTIDVTVTGKRFVIEKLTADDLIAAASASSVDSSGTKTLPITVTSKDNNINYEITSLSKNNINVFFDTMETRKFNIIPEINITDGVIKENYQIGTPTLSCDSIDVSGPSTELNKLKEIKAVININSELNESKTFDPELIMKSIDGNSFKYLTFEKADKNITVFVPLLKNVKLPTAVTFNNVPDFVDKNNIKYKIYPSELTVAIQIEALEKNNSVIISDIDYSMLNDGTNTISFQKDDIDYNIVDDIGSVKVSVYKD